jgi:hypothetical protein
MKQLSLIKFLLFIACFSNAQKQNSWPVLNTYDQEHIDRIAMPAGEIGTGTVSLSAYGALIDWEIMSSLAKGFTPKYAGVEVINRAPFFSIHIKEENKEVQALLFKFTIDKLKEMFLIKISNFLYSHP